MKHIIIILIFLIVFSSCSDDNFGSPAIVSDELVTNFEELLILINVKLSDSTFLVVKSIDSVNIYINAKFWAKVNSTSIDTKVVNKFEIENMFVTEKKLNYLTIARQDIDRPDFNTAGDFSKYLNSMYHLQEGEYICFIESFQVTYNDNSIHTFYPYMYKIFNVEEGKRSAFVGEFEINL